MSVSVASPRNPATATCPPSEIRLRWASSQWRPSKNRIGLRAGPSTSSRHLAFTVILIRLGARHIKGMHAAMRAECVLSHAGGKSVDGQRVLAAQQFEIRREDREVENPLLRANTATALRQEVQIDPGTKPHSAAMAATFAGFKHHTAPSGDPRACVANPLIVVHCPHCKERCDGVIAEEQSDAAISIPVHHAMGIASLRSQ